MEKQDVLDYFNHKVSKIKSRDIDMRDMRMISDYIKLEKGKNVTPNEIAMSINNIYHRRPFDGAKLVQGYIQFMLKKLFIRFEVTILQDKNKKTIKVY